MAAEIGTDVLKAATILRAGGLVAMPTETVYGLAANGLNPEAVARIFTAKGRPAFDPLILHFPNPEAVSRCVSTWPPQAQPLADAFWPGPLTLVVPKAAHVPDIATSGLDTVGVRVPNHPLALQLLQSVDFPLAAPSANPFGYVSPTTAQHVAAQLGQKVDYILDGGPCQVGLESTIVGFPNGTATVLRMGGIGLEDLERVLGHRPPTLLSSSQPQAPGQLTAHYAPSVAIRLITDWRDLPTGTDPFGLIAFSEFPTDFTGQGIILAPDAQTETAAQRLFAALRETETWGVPQVYAQLAPEIGLGPAINDRLRRAAASEL